MSNVGFSNFVRVERMTSLRSPGTGDTPFEGGELGVRGDCAMAKRMGAKLFLGELHT